MDRITKQQRSKNMGKIKSTNTGPEIFIRKLLFSHGYRYRLYNRKLPGVPDIVLKKYKTVILVHGCFWHSHENCKKATLPETNKEFWEKKLKTNKNRDIKVKEELIKAGYRVLIIWQCACIKKHSEKLFNKIVQFLNSEHFFSEIGLRDVAEK